MATYAIWYDNGTRWYDSAELVEADSPEAALRKVSGVKWSEHLVATAGWYQDPNADRDNILASVHGGQTGETV